MRYNLTGLDLTDPLILLLEPCKEKLKELNLSGNHRLTDKSFTYLSDLENLTTLDLNGCPLLTDEGLDLLDKLPLTNLNLNRCDKITQNGIDNLLKTHPNKRTTIKELLAQHNPPLKKLDLTGLNLNDITLELLEELPTLENLTLKDCTWLIDEGLKSVKNLPKLATLNLRNCTKLTDEALESLKQLQRTTVVLPETEKEKIYKSVAFGNDKWSKVFGEGTIR